MVTNHNNIIGANKMRNLKAKCGCRASACVILLTTAGMSLAEEVTSPESEAYSLLERKDIAEDWSPAPSEANPRTGGDVREASPYDLGYQKRIESVQPNGWGLPQIRVI